MLNKKATEGFSLLELMLALTAAIILVMLSIQQYLYYRSDADANALGYNVALLSQAASEYHYANCSKGGNLDPATNPANPFILNIGTDLTAKGFLTVPIVRNPLVDATGPDNGYTVQLNQVTMPRNVCTTTGCATQKQVGTIVLWEAQIGVFLKNTSIAPTLKSKLAADCISTRTTFNSVVICSEAANFSTLCQFYRNTPNSDPNYSTYNTLANTMGCPLSGNANSYNNYLVFTRMPSSPVPSVTSTFWGTNSTMLQFKQMYTTNPIIYTTGTSHTTEYQYFYCGS